MTSPRTFVRRLAVASLALLAPASLAVPSVAQAPAAPAATPAAPVMMRLRNAQVLPADISQDELRSTMRAFTVALGVRCSHCHADGEDVPFPNRDWASDANPKKNVARGMMRLTQRLNATDLPAVGLPLGDAPPPRVTCYSCHGGATRPALAPPPTAPAQ